MSGTKEINYQDGNGVTRQVQWVLMGDENDHDHDHESEVVDSDFEECSDDDLAVESESCSSSDLVEDASSSPTSTSTSSSSYGPLYELSELMAQLPIKRGLSKYYQGKSESFASLASVKSLEDLAKKGDFMSYNRRMKPCKSFGDSQRFGPKATIAKKTSSRAKRDSANLVGSLIRSSVQKHF